MNLEDLGNIGEFVASIGVIVSLLFLGFQIRAQTIEEQSATTNQLTQQWLHMFATISSDGTFGEMWLRGVESFENLNPVDRIRFGTFIGQMMQVTESLELHHRTGKMDDGIWMGYDSRMKDILANPGVRQWWAIRKHWYSPGLQSYCDTLIADAPENDGYAGYRDSDDD